jgi:hypothetical protein
MLLASLLQAATSYAAAGPNSRNRANVRVKTHLRVRFFSASRTRGCVFFRLNLLNLAVAKAIV